MKTIVLYHANCTDGAGAMWSAWKHFGDKAKYIAVGHDSKKQSNILRQCKKASRVYMCDMMLNPEDIGDIVVAGAEVYLLDHHITNIEKFAAYDFGDDDVAIRRHIHDFNDLERSGAGITWDHFHGGSRPAVIDYVESFDLWNWSLPDGESIHTLLSQCNWKSQEQILERFNEYEQMTPGHMAAKGAPLLAYRNDLIERNMAQVGRARVTVDGHTYHSIPILNANQLISETGNMMAENEHFAIIWQVMKTGQIRISLRSDEHGEDVAYIAQHLGIGGGGHVKASGTRYLSIDDMLKEIEFI